MIGGDVSVVGTSGRTLWWLWPLLGSCVGAVAAATTVVVVVVVLAKQQILPLNATTTLTTTVEFSSSRHATTSAATTTTTMATTTTTMATTTTTMATTTTTAASTTTTAASTTTTAASTTTTAAFTTTTAASTTTTAASTTTTAASTTTTAASTLTTAASTTTTTSFMTTSAAGTTTIVTKSSCLPADLTSLFFVREAYPDSELDGGVYTIVIDEDFTTSFQGDNTYRGYLFFANKTFSGQISRLVFGFENVGFAAISLGDYPNRISTWKNVITPMSNNRNEGVEVISPGSTYICTDVELYYKPIEDIKPVVIKLIRIEMCSGSLVPIDPDVYEH